MKRALLYLFPLLCLVLLSCTQPGPKIPAERHALGEGFALALDRGQGHIVILENGKPVIGSFGSLPFFSVGLGHDLRGKPSWTNFAHIETVEKTPTGQIHLEILLWRDSGEAMSGTAVFTSQGKGHLELAFGSNTEKDFESVRLNLRSDTKEAMLGPGFFEAHTNRQGLSTWVDGSYHPPFYLSNGGYGLMAQTSRMVRFDFTALFRSSVDINDHTAQLYLFTGNHPLKIIERLTAYTGRYSAIPFWTTGTWLTIGGDARRIGDRTNAALSGGASLSALWATDWPLEPWLTEDDPMKPLIQNLGKTGIGVVGTLGASFAPEGVLAKEGLEKGFLLPTKKPPERPVWPDLEKPASVKWFTEHLKATLLRHGAAGWVAKADGPDSQYDLRWMELSQSIIDRYGVPHFHTILGRYGRRDLDVQQRILFAREQSARWESLSEAICAVQSAGICGVPFVGPGIGGKRVKDGFYSNREMFMRWVEVGAHLPIFRIEDSRKEDGLWPFDADPVTLKHFARLTHQRNRLRVYLQQCIQEAADTGHPVIRHPYLVFPEDPMSLQTPGQFFIGDKILVAPVLKDGLRNHQVYFPEGKWIRLEETHWQRGPGWRTVPAELGSSPAFRRIDWNLP